MDIESILDELAHCGTTFPRQALQEAIAQREAVTPHLLDVLEQVGSNADDWLDERVFLVSWALLLVAQFREVRAYPLVVRIAALPSAQLHQLLGDLLTEDLARILASVCDGDVRPIERLIEDPTIDQYVRDAGMRALLCLVVAGQRSREEVLEYFRHLFHTAKASRETIFWSALTHLSSLLYPDLVLAEIREAFEADRINPLHISPRDVERSMQRGMEAARAGRERDRHYRLVEDTIAESEWWDCFQPHHLRSVYRPLSLPELTPLSSFPPKAFPAAARQTQDRVPSKLGRNDRCPCGSGLKYKKCCLKNER